ncbi:MAG: hypothetical protein ACI8RD_013879, partial [Bacillariaceae sp.]
VGCDIIFKKKKVSCTIYVIIAFSVVNFKRGVVIPKVRRKFQASVAVDFT